MTKATLEEGERLALNSKSEARTVLPRSADKILLLRRLNRRTRIALVLSGRVEVEHELLSLGVSCRS